LIECPDGDGSRHPARFREGLRERRAHAAAIPMPASAIAPGSGTITSVPVASVKVSVWFAGLVPWEVQTPPLFVNVRPA
jgi:hypothetical protein